MCVFVCLFIHIIFEKPMQLWSPSLTETWCTMSPGNPFILGSKGQRSGSRGTKPFAGAWVITLLWVLASSWILLTVSRRGAEGNSITHPSLLIARELCYLLNAMARRKFGGYADGRNEMAQVVLYNRRYYIGLLEWPHSMAIVAIMLSFMSCYCMSACMQFHISRLFVYQRWLQFP